MCAAKYVGEILKKSLNSVISVIRKYYMSPVGLIAPIFIICSMIS